MSFMASALKNNLDLKAFLVLWGAGNSGKTSTLRMLIEELSKNPAVSMFLSKRKEFRIIVEYKGIYIYLSTYGDTLEDTQANIAFFDGELNATRIFIYRINSPVVKLNAGFDYIHNYTPSFCISASRSDGRVPFPLNFYGQKMRIHTSSIVWLHKEKEVRLNHQIANRNHAKELHKFIDDKMSGSLI